jgi:hypothetical protein
VALFDAMQGVEVIRREMTLLDSKRDGVDAGE